MQAPMPAIHESNLPNGTLRAKPPSSGLRRALRRAAMIVGGLVLAVVAFGGAVHIKALRPFFSRLGIGCPAWGAKAGEVAATRERGLAVLRGATTAPSRPALGVVLDETTQDAALAWAKGGGLDCKDKTMGLANFACTGRSVRVFGEAGIGKDVLSLSFDARHRLILVDVLRRELDGASAERTLTSTRARLVAALGEPMEQAGELSGAYLAGGPMHTATYRYRFADYLAFVTATNLPSGICVHETYQSASAPASAS